MVRLSGFSVVRGRCRRGCGGVGRPGRGLRDAWVAVAPLARRVDRASSTRPRWTMWPRGWVRCAPCCRSRAGGVCRARSAQRSPARTTALRMSRGCRAGSTPTSWPLSGPPYRGAVRRSPRRSKHAGRGACAGGCGGPVGRRGQAARGRSGFGDQPPTSCGTPAPQAGRGRARAVDSHWCDSAAVDHPPQHRTHRDSRLGAQPRPAPD